MWEPTPTAPLIQLPAGRGAKCELPKPLRPSPRAPCEWQQGGTVPRTTTAAPHRCAPQMMAIQGPPRPPPRLLGLPETWELRAQP